MKPLPMNRLGAHERTPANVDFGLLLPWPNPDGWADSGSSHPGKTSTPGWTFNASASTFARSTPRRTRSFSTAEMVACGIGRC